ncbi:MAG: hypothetical protein MI861_15870 [Pirellulales bacterium]|nr:hypothetical protein [Pirellulales bacterium]
MGATLDSLVSSESGFKILVGTTLGTPFLTAFCLAKGLRRFGDEITPVAFGIAIGLATVVGLFTGLTVIAYKRFQRMSKDGSVIPWHYRLMFEGQPMKLVFVGIPLLFVGAIVCGILLA